MVAALALLLGAQAVSAYHEKSEPSDGTVRSFKTLAQPRAAPGRLSFVDPQGRQTPLGEFRGKVVLLNLWATWCPPCVRELPALDRLQARLGGEDFAVVAVSLDEGGTAQAAPFFERLGIEHLALYADPNASLKQFFPIDVLPANFILDRQGRVTHFLRSYVDWDGPDVDRLFDDLVREGRSAIPGTAERSR